MATRYLGAEFDIHGGGLDLRFPHHENELAQSTAAGHSFARHWIHNGLVNTGGQKMSKSLGNSLFAADLLAAARPIVLRYFLGSAHYRSVLEYSQSSLAEAEAAFSRIEGFLEKASDGGVGELPTAFVDAMSDDFAVPQALAALHGAVRAGNTALDAGDQLGAAKHASDVTAMLDVLGLNPNDSHWAASRGTAATAAESTLAALVESFLSQRAEARADKDFATSDAIRDSLQAAGIALEDGPNNTRWSIA